MTLSEPSVGSRTPESLPLWTQTLVGHSLGVSNIQPDSGGNPCGLFPVLWVVQLKDFLRGPSSYTRVGRVHTKIYLLWSVVPSSYKSTSFREGGGGRALERKTFPFALI